MLETLAKVHCHFDGFCNGLGACSFLLAFEDVYFTLLPFALLFDLEALECIMTVDAEKALPLHLGRVEREAKKMWHTIKHIVVFFFCHK